MSSLPVGQPRAASRDLKIKFWAIGTFGRRSSGSGALAEQTGQ
jgi:hypothetical protein